MTLSELFTDVTEVSLGSAGSAAAVEVRDDSRAVGPGDVFVAVSGAKADGRSFVADALARGAAVVVAEARDEGLRATIEQAGAVLVTVPDVRRALARLAARRFGAAGAMTLTAVTGTNGKTTTTHVIEAILQAAGRRPGLVGTVHYRYPGVTREAPLTTPGALQLHGLLAEMKAAACTDVVLEASSHALDQGRLEGCRFRAAALTNVTQDHLDYHGTMEAYAAAKGILFRELLEPAQGTAVLFADREDGRKMMEAVRGRSLTVATTPGARADVRVTRVNLDGHGTRGELQTPAGPLSLSSPLVGDFNLQNLVLAVGVSLALEVPVAAIERGLADLAGVPGRLERIDNDAGVLCVVDYAHTPDGIERALAALRPLVRGRLIVVFGCGGDRDKTKRPVMGELVARGADVGIVTSDNPRTEDPAAIVAMIVDGVRAAGARVIEIGAVARGETGVAVALDRRLAIRCAVMVARPGDVVLLAGKGHEDYQILGTTKVPFDDRREAREAFAARSAASTGAGR